MDELCGRHVPVGAVAVEEEIGAESAGVFVEVEAGVLGGDLLKDSTETVETVVISKDVVELEAGEFCDELVEPGFGGLERFFFVSESAPAEVEGVAVENEGVGAIQPFVKAGYEIFSD